MEKVAIVTGGTRGIGRAIVKKLSEEGYWVYFLFKKNAEKARELVEIMSGKKVKAFQCSIERLDLVQEVIQDIHSQTGRIDVLVNNAGITRDNLFALMSQEEFKEVIEVNLLGTFNVTSAVVRHMIHQKSGVIVNISSIAGILGPKGQCNYAASKAGIIAFSKSLSRELGKYGIRVVAVAPGWVETEMYAKVPIQQRKQLLSSVSLGRVAKPEEIANVVSFIVSEKASYITGTTIIVDGGI